MSTAPKKHIKKEKREPKKRLPRESMYWRRCWHQSLCDSSDNDSKTTSFLTSFPLWPGQHPSLSSTKVLILILEPSVTNPRTSFSRVKHRWPPSKHHNVPSSNNDTGVTVPLTTTRSENTGFWRSGRTISLAKRTLGKAYSVSACDNQNG